MRSFVDIFVDYMGFKTDACKLYARILILQLIGHLLSKNSKVYITPEIERLNLYVMLIGSSYYARKSAVQDMVMNLYPVDKILPNESSAEKFIVNLVDTPDGVWAFGEFSKILKHIKKGGYLSNIAETLNDLYKYDRELYKRELMNDTYEIRKPYPSFNTTLTPEVLMEQVTPEMLDGGLFGRMILIPSNNDGEIRPRGRLPKELFKIKCNLKRQIECMSAKKFAINFEFDDGGFEAINEVELELSKEKTARAIAGRYGQAIIKISAIEAFGEDFYNKVILPRLATTPNTPNTQIHKHKQSPVSADMDQVVKVMKESEVDLQNLDDYAVSSNYTITIKREHVMKAFDMVKPGIELAKKLVEYSKMNKSYIIKTREYIKENYPVKRSEVMYRNHLDRYQMKEAEATLVEQEVIDRIVFKASNGKPTTVYCLPDVDGSSCKNCEFKKGCRAYKEALK